jgi:hypothetical protein
MMRSSSALFAGMFAAILGVALWVSAVEFLGVELPWGGLIVGVFVGAGVILFREGAAKSDLAFVGGFLTMVSVTGGTVLLDYIDTRYDDDFIVGNLAEGILKSFEDMGHTLEWRKQSDPAQQYAQAGYPPDLWRKAQEMWQQASPQQRLEYRDEIETEHQLAFLTVAKASMDREAIVFLGGGMLVAVMLGVIFGGHVHESVILTAYQDAAENEHVETHPYLAPGSEYGFTEIERLPESTAAVAALGASDGAQPESEATESDEPSGSDSSFAGFAATPDAPVEDALPDLVQDDESEGQERKKAG